VVENNKLSTFLREVNIKLNRKKHDLIVSCTAVLESEDKNLETINKIQN
jgi:hypothetical protein